MKVNGPKNTVSKLMDLYGTPPKVNGPPVHFTLSSQSIRSPIKLNQDVPPVPVCRGTVSSIHSYTQHQNFCWRLPRSIEVESFFYNKVESFIVATSVTAHKFVYVCTVTDQLGASILGFFHSIHLTSTPKS